MADVPRPSRPTGWALPAGGSLVALMALVAGCATTTTPAPTNGQPAEPVVNAPPPQPDIERLSKVRIDLASAYFARGQNSDALDEIKQLLQVRPDDAEAYGLRGLIVAAMGDAGTAEDSFRKSLQLAPHNGDTMHNFGWFLCQRQRYDEADAEFQRALAEPTYRAQARTLLAQGVCQARGGHLPESEKILSHAYELDPGNPTTAVNLAEVLYKQGDFERARFYIRRVNAKQEFVNAQTLWLAAQIERKLGQEDLVQQMGAQLHDRFPQAPETLLFDKGRFE